MSNFKSAVLSVVGSRLLSKATVLSNEAVGNDFRKIEIKSDSLKNSSWRAGSKIQIDTGEWNLRTYTPLSLDSEKGLLSFLAFLPGTGPGAQWAKSVKPGSETHFKGPDGSIDFSQGLKSLMVFGDETSFGLAAGIKKTLGTQAKVEFLFEVSSQEGVSTALESLNLDSAILFEKSPGIQVSLELMAALLKLKSENPTCEWTLSGRAQSIQAIRKNLSSAGSKTLTKVYWSEGKTGLD
jgi:ferric-chelate reductase (NADPH)